MRHEGSIAAFCAMGANTLFNIVNMIQGRRGYGLGAPARQAEARQSADGARPVWCAPCGTITVIRADPSGSSSLTISASRIGAGFRITCLRWVDDKDGEKIEKGGVAVVPPGPSLLQ